MLLTIGHDPKTVKGEKKGYLTAVMYLAPHYLSSYNVCPMATAGCSAACLNTAGRGGMFKKGETTNAIQEARIRRTVMFFEEREKFMAQLVKEITKHIKTAEKREMIPVVRLNGTSDLRWETIPVGDASNIMALFPNIQFYDYTKIYNRRNLPKNYHLTFSLAENNDVNARTVLKASSMNVAAVFHKVPDTFWGYKVINGDESDLRFLDEQGVIVGLKAKGKARKDTSGFVR